MPAKDAGLSSFPFLIHISCFWSLCCQLNGRNHRKCCPVRTSPLKQQVLPSSSPWLMNSDGERQEPKVTLVGACISHLCSLLGKGLGQLHTSFWLDWFCQAKKWVSLLWKAVLWCWMWHSSAIASSRHIIDALQLGSVNHHEMMPTGKRSQLGDVFSGSYFSRMDHKACVLSRCHLHREDSFACLSKTTVLKSGFMLYAKADFSHECAYESKQSAAFFLGATPLILSHCPDVRKPCCANRVTCVTCPSEGTQGRGWQRLKAVPMWMGHASQAPVGWRRLSGSAPTRCTDCPSLVFFHLHGD